MSKTAYPTATDLQNFLTAAGVTLGTLDTATAVQAGIDDFERRTSRKMLAPAGTQTRYYDPPVNRDGCLNLVRDLATLTSVVYQPQGGSSETLTEYTDFWLRPHAAPSDDPPHPWTGLQLRRCWIAPPAPELRRAIRVTGRWGFGTAIPEDAWLAMVMRGAALLAPSAGEKLSTGYVSYESAGVVQFWGDEPYRGARISWTAAFNLAVRRYQRLSL